MNKIGERELIFDLKKNLREARKGLIAVQALINESYGVTGLHLNGNTAPWEELQTGGQYEEWLMDFDAAYNQVPVKMLLTENAAKENRVEKSES